MKTIVEQLMTASAEHPQRAAYDAWLATNSNSADDLRRADLIFKGEGFLTFTENRQTIKVANRIGRLEALAKAWLKTSKTRKPTLAKAKRVYPTMIDGMTVKDYVRAFYQANGAVWSYQANGALGFSTPMPYRQYDATSVNDFFQPLSNNPQSSVVLDNIEETIE